MKNSKALVERICQLAKQKNRDELEDLLASGVSIGVMYCNESAVLKLARENDVEAVEFLMEEFSANCEQALIGAAEGGHSQLIAQLNQIETMNHPIVYGAVKSGRFNLAQEWLDENLYLYYAVDAAAESGRVDLTLELIKREAGRPIRALKEHAIQSAAMAGNASFIQTLVDNGAEEKDAIFGAALGGHEELMQKLIKKHGRTWQGAWGAAQGGHYDLMRTILQQSEDELKVVVQYAAKCGNNPIDTGLLECELGRVDAVKGAIYGRHFSLVNELINNAPDKNEFKEQIAAACSGLYLSLRESECFLAHIDDVAIREQLAVSMGRVDLNRINKINHAMRTYQIGYPQAVACLKPELLTLCLQVMPSQFLTSLPIETVVIILSKFTGLSCESAECLSKKMLRHHAPLFFQARVEAAQRKLDYHMQLTR